MSLTLSTSVSAIDNAGTAWVYVPPNVVAIPRGYNVANGTYQQINAGDQVSLAGIYQFANGSGQFQATGLVTYRVVTVTAPGPIEEAPEEGA